MFGLGGPELLIILCIALLVFGPKRLPDVGRTLGKAARDFKNSVGEIDEIKDSLKVDLEARPGGRSAEKKDPRAG